MQKNKHVPEGLDQLEYEAEFIDGLENGEPASEELTSPYFDRKLLMILQNCNKKDRENFIKQWGLGPEAYLHIPEHLLLGYYAKPKFPYIGHAVQLMIQQTAHEFHRAAREAFQKMQAQGNQIPQGV